MRPCGCDWDTHVFGHAYCWTTHIGLFGGKHVTCDCAACDCPCHKDKPWPLGGSSLVAQSSAS